MNKHYNKKTSVAIKKRGRLREPPQKLCRCADDLLNDVGHLAKRGAALCRPRAKFLLACAHLYKPVGCEKNPNLVGEFAGIGHDKLRKAASNRFKYSVATYPLKYPKQHFETQAHHRNVLIRAFDPDGASELHDDVSAGNDVGRCENFSANDSCRHWTEKDKLIIKLHLFLCRGIDGIGSTISRMCGQDQLEALPLRSKERECLHYNGPRSHISNPELAAAAGSENNFLI